jgi:hypothetical protein
MHALRGRVYVVEPLGRQREVTIEVGGQRIAVVTPHEDVIPDSLLTISAPPNRLLLFERESGRRVPLGALAATPARPRQEAEVGSRG